MWVRHHSQQARCVHWTWAGLSVPLDSGYHEWRADGGLVLWLWISNTIHCPCLLRVFMDESTDEWMSGRRPGVFPCSLPRLHIPSHPPRPLNSTFYTPFSVFSFYYPERKTLELGACSCVTLNKSFNLSLSVFSIRWVVGLKFFSKSLPPLLLMGSVSFPCVWLFLSLYSGSPCLCLSLKWP